MKISAISLLKALYAQWLGYHIVNNDLLWRPDITIRKYKSAVFVDGELWHGHDWENKRAKIKTNIKFWIAKIERNMQIYIQNYSKLELLGYEAFRFSSMDIKGNSESCEVSNEFSKGFSKRKLELIRKFSLTYKIAKTPFSQSIVWPHFLHLIRAENEYERKFYEIEIEYNNWSVQGSLQYFMNRFLWSERRPLFK